MQQITPEQISQNWDNFLSYIDIYISEPRKFQLTQFYKQYEERLILMPASHKVAYHECGPGGYIDHVNRVISSALEIERVWRLMGTTNNFTTEELVFSALNHDLGKMGSKDEPLYIPNTSQWHAENRGEIYECNTKVSYMSVPDRSLYLLTEHGISFTENEYLAIKLHDGMYDESNKPYLASYIPETKPRTSLIYIIHQADMMASRIEWEHEWMNKLYQTKVKKNQKFGTKQEKINKSLKDMKIDPNVLAKLIE